MKVFILRLSIWLNGSKALSPLTHHTSFVKTAEFWWRAKYWYVWTRLHSYCVNEPSKSAAKRDALVAVCNHRKRPLAAAMAPQTMSKHCHNFVKSLKAKALKLFVGMETTFVFTKQKIKFCLKLCVHGLNMESSPRDWSLNQLYF